jgi:hypothetical protein
MPRQMVMRTMVLVVMAAFTVLAESPVEKSDNKTRVFVTDSDSWQTSGGFAGASAGGNGGVVGSSSGGARPQTAEIMKTFAQRCPQITITINREKADYIVILEHEGGKDLILRDNKFALFNKDGDMIQSGSTRSLGNAVKDACAVIAAKR